MPRKSKIEKTFSSHNSFNFSGRAEQEAKITSEKDQHIKTVEADILQLKADIYNLKVFIEFHNEYINLKIFLIRMFTENTQCTENF